VLNFQGTSVEAETRRETNSPDRTPRKSYSATNYRTRQGLDPDEYARVGAKQFVADTAKEGVRKATQVADTIGDAAKETIWMVHGKQPKRLTKRLERQ
jgi:hypothetical protein